MKPRFASMAVRAVADILVVVTSLAASFAMRFWIALFEPHPLTPQELLTTFMSHFLTEGPVVVLLLVATCAAFGVYTRTRAYRQQFKGVVVWQAVSLAYGTTALLFFFISDGKAFMPRGVFLTSYVLTAAGSVGARLLKGYLERRFTVEAKQPAAERPVQKVLVVGGAGYIGSGMVRDLLADGYRVRVLDWLAYGDESIRDLYGHPAFQLVRGDFRHVEPVVQAVKGMDAVIHLGAIVGDPACAVNEDETLETNLVATRLLADVCRASSVSRVLFASTCSVYGAAEEVVDEHSQLNPVSLYAATKIDSESVLLAVGDHHFHSVILRLATAFGWSYRPRFDLVVNLLAAKAVAEGKITIYNGEQWRPFIHVADISRAFRLMLTVPLEAVSGEVFNVGSNNMNFTLRELAEQIRGLEPNIAVEYVSNSDARNYRVSFDKIRQRLNFECRTTLTDGIREIQDAFARGLVEDYRDTRYSNVQLVTKRSQRLADGNQKIALTTLRFAKSSRWSHALASPRS